MELVARAKKRRKIRPPRPPNIKAWMVMRVLVVGVSLFWASTELLTPLADHILWVVFSWVDYWVCSNHAEWSITYKRPAYQWFLFGLTGSYGYIVVCVVDMFALLFGKFW